MGDSFIAGKMREAFALFGGGLGRWKLSEGFYLPHVMMSNGVTILGPISAPSRVNAALARTVCPTLIGAPLSP